MATISLTISGETPTGVSVVALARTDTDATPDGVALPAAMTPSGGQWVYAFDDPAPGLVYAYTARVAWADGTTTDVTGTTAAAAGAEGYYAKRRQVLLTAGADNFNAAFNLDAAEFADEAVVQEVLDLADRYVDDTAYELGVAKATDDHYVDTTHEAFSGLSYWASRWARAQGYLLRGTAQQDPTTGPEGQMTAMKAEAEQRIERLLTAAIAKDDDDATNPPGTFVSVPVRRAGASCARDEYAGDY